MVNYTEEDETVLLVYNPLYLVFGQMQTLSCQSVAQQQYHPTVY